MDGHQRDRLLVLAHQLHEQGEGGQAEKLTTAVLRAGADPDQRLRALRLRARCRRERGADRGAWADLAALCAEAPDDAWAPVEQARLLAAHGREEDAVDAILAVARRHPADVDAWRLADTLTSGDPRAGAQVEALLGRTAAEPDASEPAVRAADLLCRLGRADEALAVLDRAPDDADTRRARIAALDAAGRLDEAGPLLAGLSPRDDEDAAFLSRAALLAGDLDRAWAWARGLDRAMLAGRLGRSVPPPPGEGSLERTVLHAAVTDWAAVPVDPESDHPPIAALQAEALRRSGHLAAAHDRFKGVRERALHEAPALLLALHALSPSPELADDLVRIWAPRLPPDLPPDQGADWLVAHADRLIDDLGGAWDDLLSWRDGDRLRVVRATPTVRRRLALVQRTLRAGGFPAAIARFDRLVDELPDHPLALTYRGELHLWSGDLAAAQADMDRALSLDPTTRWAWVATSLIQSLRGEPARALQTLDQGEQQAGRLVAAAPARCEALLALGELDACSQALDDSLRQRPARVSAWLLRAIVARRQGRPALAIEAALADQLPDLWAAGDGEGMDRLASVRAALCGNRSSQVLTWRHPRGGFVVRSTLRLAVDPG